MGLNSDGSSDHSRQSNTGSGSGERRQKRLLARQSFNEESSTLTRKSFNRPFSIGLDPRRFSQLINSDETLEIIDHYSEMEESSDYYSAGYEASRSSSDSKINKPSAQRKSDLRHSLISNSTSIQDSTGRSQNSSQRGRGGQKRRDSAGTVSTAMLLDFDHSKGSSGNTNRISDNTGSSARNTDSSGYERRTSSFYPTMAIEILTPKHTMTDALNKNIEDSNGIKSAQGKDRNSVKSSEPQLDDAVDLLRNEMVGSSPTNKNFAFVPYDFKIPKRFSSQESLKLVSNSQPSSKHSSYETNKKLINRSTPSLLKHSLVAPTNRASSVYSTSSKTIPALRDISGSTKWNVTPPINTPITPNKVDESQEFEPNSETTKNTGTVDNVKLSNNNNDNNNENVIANREAPTITEIPQKPMQAKLQESGDPFSASQIDLIIDTVNGYKNLQKSNEKLSQDDTDGPQHLPAQRVDSNSVTSMDSTSDNMWSLYSIPRLLMLLCVCLVIPPIFFIIGVGPKGMVSDYRLMRLVMNQHHRLGLLKGFIWDIDITWLRKTCLILGIIELAVVAAMIGVGFGVGIRNETH